MARAGSALVIDNDAKESPTMLPGLDDAKVRNLRAEPRVSLHLDIDRADGDGGGVLTVEGEAAVEPGPLTGDEAARYVAKYRATMDLVGVTKDEFLAEYSTVVRITSTRTRAY